jgi:SAM-dependent methyltransferase
MQQMIEKIYHNRIFSWLFPTTVYCLRKNLRDCQAVLDLGCGLSSPLKYCKNIKYSVGVEAFKSYLEESKKRKIHSEYIEKKIEDVDFPEKSFDAVIMIEVLEHLPENAGYAMLKKADKWARKKVIISTPNGFLRQRARDGNELQQHLSGWETKTLKKMGFKCYGLSGLRRLHGENPEDIETSGNDFTASMRWRPKVFWFTVAAVSQLVTYFMPSLAFEIFCIKKIYESNN